MRLPRPLRGRILRIKPGYNPNSSSVGSLVTTFLWSAGLGMIALNFLMLRLFRRRPDDPGERAGD